MKMYEWQITDVTCCMPGTHLQLCSFIECMARFEIRMPKRKRYCIYCTHLSRSKVLLRTDFQFLLRQRIPKNSAKSGSV